MTIEDIWHEVRLIQPDIARVTMFRIVELLVLLGIVDWLTFPDGPFAPMLGKGQCGRI